MAGLVIDPIEFHAANSPDAPAVICRHRTLTYDALRDRARGVAEQLMEAGVKPGDIVGIVGGNSIEWCVAAIAAMYAGAVATGFNHRFVARELAVLVDNSRPRVVFADADHLAVMRTLQAEHSFSLIPLADVEHAAVPTAQGDQRLAQLRDRMEPSKPVMIIYTSGTTGSPKGVIHTHQTVLSTVFETALLEGFIGSDSRRLAVLPMATAAGIYSSLLHQVVRGGCVVLEPEFDADAALDAIVNHRVTWISGPPIVFERLSQARDFEVADLSGVRFATVGGARVPSGLMHQWLKKGVVLRQLYGCTETGGFSTLASLADAIERPESCGRGGVLTTVRVVRPDLTECETGEPGQIVIKGPGCSPGYWGNEQATAALYVEGWLQTGDVGIRDEDGTIVFQDRAKDIIISGGLNISPREIEDVLGEYPGVREVCVIPVADAKFGETPAAIVYAEPAPDISELIAYCGARLADYKIPRFVEVLDEPLPRMPSGKADKVGLKSRYGDMATTHTKVR